jgi:competence protein ComGC
MEWLIVFFIVSGLLFLLFWAIVASGARHDELTYEAFARMLHEENNTWKYDTTETTTSGCPTELPLDKGI